MKIDIKCHSKDTLLLSELADFQGNLKERTISDIERITASIKEFGFSFPFFVWQNDGKNNIIDGHGRLEALNNLAAEGYDIPPLPIVYITANSADEAKSLLLHVNSLYGETNRDELLTLIEECGANIDDLSFPQFTLESFIPNNTGEVFEPELEPEISTSEVKDKDIERAEEKVFDMTKNDHFIDFTCKECNSQIFIKRDIIVRYLKGEHV